LLPYQVTAYLRNGVIPGRHGTAFPLIAPYQVFRAADGELMIAAGNDGLFHRLCDALGVPELAEDPRFATNPNRLARREELAALIQERIGDQPAEELLVRLRDAGVPAAPVNDVGQAADHEQTMALGLIQSSPEPTLALPLSVDGERVLHRAAPPRLGEHTGEILRELGYSDADVRALAAQRVIGGVESSA
jgi:formyl-CoA transferase/CoA:oxalate CoA-transferase